MLTTVEALQTLYVALGGQAEDVANLVTIPDMIVAIASIVPSGSSLPAVSGENDGQVLTVVDGAWASADAPSGLPDVTDDDNGDVLKVVDGAWAKATS